MKESMDYREISHPSVLETQPLVSVHMLAYRHASFIGQAIESIVCQACDFPFELVIAEDCSPDNTLEVVLKYQREYPSLIRVITGERNVGMLENSERSTALLRGKYIATCEGDDYWNNPRKLQMQVDAMTSSNNVTLCHTEYDREYRSSIKRNQHRAENSPHLAQGQAYESLLHHWTVMTVTTMYRADIVRQFKASVFSDRKWPFGDYNQALFAAANGEVVYLPTSTATWRKLAGSATNENVQGYLNMALAYAECRERFMASYPVPDEVALSVRSESHQRIMERSFWAGRLDLFDECHAWLKHHHGNPNALITLLKRTVLRSSLLTQGAQSLRTFVRRLKLVNR